MFERRLQHKLVSCDLGLCDCGLVSFLKLVLRIFMALPGVAECYRFTVHVKFCYFDVVSACVCKRCVVFEVWCTFITTQICTNVS